MKKKRQNHSAAFKAKVAVEAIKGLKTSAELASQYGVHPTQIAKWKKRVLEEVPGIFSGRQERAESGREVLVLKGHTSNASRRCLFVRWQARGHRKL